VPGNASGLQFVNLFTVIWWVIWCILHTSEPWRVWSSSGYWNTR